MPDPAEPNVVIDNRFTLQSLLGRGGFGEVWRASDADGHSVAVKLLLEPNPDVEDILRLKREAQISAHLGARTSVVAAQEYGHCASSGRHFVVYDLIENASTLQVRSGSLPQRLTQLAAAARAVAEAHDAGVVHRDVKPVNFLFGSDRVVRLHDFGLAKLTSDTEIERDDETIALSTHRAIIFGSPSYMSLEQLESAKLVDARTDVFALGASLFEGLMGDVWIKGSFDKVRKQLYQIDAGKVPAPSVERSPLLRGVPEAARDSLAHAVSAAMVVDQTNRTITASELATRIEEGLSLALGAPSAPLRTYGSFSADFLRIHGPDWATERPLRDAYAAGRAAADVRTSSDIAKGVLDALGYRLARWPTLTQELTRLISEGALRSAEIRHVDMRPVLFADRRDGYGPVLHWWNYDAVWLYTRNPGGLCGKSRSPHQAWATDRDVKPALLAAV